tara:strand:- start:68375 stop:69160 length:786 start_codon:yes stop_codon:yes gene_type:complete
MAKSNLRYLFLHYGPGGNAALERIWLKNWSSKIDFWDQPTNLGSFSDLASHCADQFKSGNYDGIIAHSFGCEIAVKVNELVGENIKSYFISPLRDIPSAFINLANFLAKSALSIERKTQLIEVSAQMEKTPNWMPKKNLSSEGMANFIKLISTISADPKYYRCFWSKSECLARYESILTQLPPLDLTCWQNVMMDFLGNHQISIQKNNLHVFVGSDDPYLGLTRDEQLYWENLEAKFSLCEKVGHYPHLESELVNNLLKSI